MRAIKAIHDRQIKEYGGLPRVRDRELLLSVLSGRENACYASERTLDIAELTAAYGLDLSKNHPLNDANKRTALIAMRLFLKLNGYDLTASVEEKYTTIIRVAANEISEATLVQWIRDNLKEIEAQLPCPDLTSTEIV